MKRFALKTLALLACLLCSLSAVAAEAYANYTSGNTTLTFYYDDLRSGRTGTTYDLNEGDNDPGWYSDGTRSSVTQVVFDSSFASARPTSTRRWFSKMSKLTSITGLNYFNTSEVTNMSAMFHGCSKLTSLSLTGFNTAKVTNMTSMFQNCTGLTSLNVGNFNMTNVTMLMSMFDNCSSLTSLDLSGWNTANMTNINFMFERCSSLITIYVGSGWTTNTVTSTSSVFNSCSSLVGGMGTTYDTNHLDKTYAHIDGGPSNPGYFSEKPNEPYACFTLSDSTLTFYYDNQRSGRPGTTYDLNTGNSSPRWNGDGTWASVTRVLFDSSFAEARPTSTASWFFKMGNLVSITGIKEYLNTSEVTNMRYMFCGCSSLTSLDLSVFNTANVTNMYVMFAGCSALTDVNLSSFNTENVTNMYGMFEDCQSLTSLNLSSFNTANVPSMEKMFAYCHNLTSLDLSSFNTANVTNMGSMFYGCQNLTSLDLSSFNTENVTNMHSMFEDCQSLTNLNLSSFNTTNVTNMDWMFDNCQNLTSLDLSSFNTANVTNMDWMFYNCKKLRTIYAGVDWSTETAASSPFMFKYCTSLVGGMGTTYDDNHVDKAYAHIDGGPSNPGYFSELPPEAYACYTPGNYTLTFYYDSQRSGREGTTFDLNEGANAPGWYQTYIYSAVKKVVFDPSFADARPTSTYDWFYNMTKLQSIMNLEYLNTSEVTNMSLMFAYCSNLSYINLTNFNTDKVERMVGMFQGCSNLRNLDLNSFNTTNVTDMSYIFYGCKYLTSLNLSHFNTSNVSYMSSMFHECNNLTNLNLSGWNTSQVTTMNCMFYCCSSLTRLDLSHFNTSKVKDMYGLFWGCSKLAVIDMGGWNTSNVESMSYMFSDCSSMTSIDLSSFNTAKVSDMYYMFGACSNLTTVYADSEWTTDAIWPPFEGEAMFGGCTNIVGGMGTTYDASHVDAEYAHIDEGPSNPGYLSEILTVLRGDVNGDGRVNVADVTEVIDYMLYGDEVDFNFDAADTNGDGRVNIGDVADITDYILHGHWF